MVTVAVVGLSGSNITRSWLVPDMVIFTEEFPVILGVATSTHFTKMAGVNCRDDGVLSPRSNTPSGSSSYDTKTSKSKCTGFIEKACSPDSTIAQTNGARSPSNIRYSGSRNLTVALSSSTMLTSDSRFPKTTKGLRVAVRSSWILNFSSSCSTKRSSYIDMEIVCSSSPTGNVI